MKISFTKAQVSFAFEGTLVEYNAIAPQVFAMLQLGTPKVSQVKKEKVRDAVASKKRKRTRRGKRKTRLNLAKSQLLEVSNFEVADEFRVDSIQGQTCDICVEPEVLPLMTADVNRIKIFDPNSVRATICVQPKAIVPTCYIPALMKCVWEIDDTLYFKKILLGPKILEIKDIVDAMDVEQIKYLSPMYAWKIWFFYTLDDPELFVQRLDEFRDQYGDIPEG